jgi:hypothetical protein
MTESIGHKIYDSNFEQKVNNFLIFSSNFIMPDTFT